MYDSRSWVRTVLYKQLDSPADSQSIVPRGQEGSMIGIRRLFLVACLSAIAAMPASAQEAVTSLSISGHAGMINSPAAFDGGDNDRLVDYSSGMNFGGGLTLQVYERLSIKGSASFSFGTGTDITSGSSQEVTLDRQFYGAGVEVLLMTGQNVEPYVFGGGGLVVVDRVGAQVTSYAYDVTEFTGVVGAGVRYLFANNTFIFLDGTNWVYNNSVTDSAQNDRSVRVGLGYRFGSN